jgi:hypothetical protein
MEKSEIRSLHVNHGLEVYIWKVGEIYMGVMVTEIVDKRNEYPDHTEFIYQVMAETKLISEVINCPVEVFFK